MAKFDEQTLMAYVDGELDPDRKAQVEAALADDPEARAAVRQFHDSAAALRGAFDPVLREPVPKRLLEAIAAPTASKVHDIRSARRRGVVSFWPQTVWARAAMIALCIGVGVGYLSASWWKQPWESAARLAVVDPLLNEALESTTSGTAFVRQEREGGVERDIMPLLTFRDADKHYCREFESSLKDQGVSHVNYGVACREGGVWQPRALMSGPLIASSLRGESAKHSEYVPAMGGEVAGFDTIVRQLMVDDPLKPEEEAALIGRGWR